MTISFGHLFFLPFCLVGEPYEYHTDLCNQLHKSIHTAVWLMSCVAKTLALDVMHRLLNLMILTCHPCRYH